MKASSTSVAGVICETRIAPKARNMKASSTSVAGVICETRVAPKARNMKARGKCEREAEHVAPG